MSKSNWSLKRAQRYVDGLLDVTRRRIHIDLLEGVRPADALDIPKIEVDFFDKPCLDAGLWWETGLIIILNKSILDRTGDEAWFDIAAHEVGHAVADYFFPDAKRWHGKEWKAITKWLGGKGCRAHEYPYDHICKAHPDLFFLYGDDKQTTTRWLTKKQHLAALSRDGWAKCKSDVDNKTLVSVRFRPDMLK